MRILVVSEGYKNYHDGAVSNELTDVVRGRGVCMWGGSDLLICCWSTEVEAGVSVA